MRHSYLVTVINSAGDYIEHIRCKTYKEAKQRAAEFGSHCIVEIWAFELAINQ